MNGLTTTQAETPAPTLEVLTLEVKFYLNQTAQNIIEVGKRLAQAKELVSHGEWQNWLESNFSLKKSTANNFMRCAERFGNFQTSGNLNSSQMVELLALPAEETEQFIAEKAAEGKPVEDMTVKQLREEVQQWKSKAEVNENALNAKQRELEDASRKVGKIAQDFMRTHSDFPFQQQENTMIIKFTVPLDPVPQPRPRIARGRTYEDPRATLFKAAVATAVPATKTARNFSTQ